MSDCPIKQYKDFYGVIEQVAKSYLTRLKNRCLQAGILSVLFLLLVGNTTDVFAAQGEEQNGQLVRVRIFTIRTISIEQAKKYLADAQIADNIVAIPNTTAISVAGKPEDLVYAANVLKLVDCNEAFEVQMLDIEQGKSLPLLTDIEKTLGSEYSVGSLLDIPSSGTNIKAITAIHKDKLLVVAPVSQKAKITEVILKSLISSKPAAAEPNVSIAIEPNVPAAVEPNATVEANLPASESKVEVSVNGKPQTEEDKMLAEFMSELADATQTEKDSQSKPVEVKKTISKAEEQARRLAEKMEAEKAEQAKVKPTEMPAETIQETAAAEKPKIADANVQFTLQTTDANDANKLPMNEVKQAAVPVVDIPNGDEELALSLPEKLEIVSLIELVGKYLNLNYLYDEQKVSGSVTIKVQGKLKVRQLYDILESVLKFRGFAMSRKGNLVTIVPVAEALDYDPAFSDDIKAGDIIVTKIFKLQYISAMTAKQLLMGMKLGNETTITPVESTGSLVITEYAFRMQRIEDLLSVIDVPGPPKEFKLRVLKYTLAESLVPKIQALAEQLGTVNVTVGATTPTTPTSPMSRVRMARTPMPTPQQTPTDATSANKTSVFIDFDKRTNRVLMIGLAAELTAVNQIIDALDVPQQDLRIIREYEIQYVDIASVITALKDFGIVDASTSTGGSSTNSPFTTSSRIRQQQQQAQTPQSVANATMSADGGAVSLSAIDQPQVVSLESTNSILVNATPEQHLQIARVVSYMDREPVQSAIPYHIYRLENQEPDKLAEVLNSLIEKTVKDKEGKVQQTIKFQEDIVVVPDLNTFSLIVYASKRNQEWIGSLIATLDTRRPQVLIDVSLVEVTQNDAFQFDLNIVANATQLVTGNLAVTGNQLIKTSTGENFEGGFNLQDSTGKNLGAVKGYYSNDKIQALLTMVDSKGYGRVLAQPKILVNDNEEGVITTSNERYVAKETQSYPGDGTTPVTTKDWTPYNAKIELKITPQISEGDLLRLEVAMVREDFDDSTTATGAPPSKITSNVTTVVTVPDGSTIILGGLNKLAQSKAGSKVPLLGDIPGAGGLFRKVNNSNDERRLYVFVKANISRPDAMRSLNQLKEISKKNQTEFEKMENKFQKYESFPGIKPEPVEPVNVLEHDDANSTAGNLTVKKENL